MTVIGQAEVEVCYEEQQVKVPLLVVKGEGPSLFGQDQLTKIRTVKCKTSTSMLESYSSVFKPGFGTSQGYEAKICGPRSSAEIFTVSLKSPQIQMDFLLLFTTGTMELPNQQTKQAR